MQIISILSLICLINNMVESGGFCCFITLGVKLELFFNIVKPRTYCIYYNVMHYTMKFKGCQLFFS